MPSISAVTTSTRLLSLLSLLQSRRDWSGQLLAERLGISERTVRRDIDRLRELDYSIQTTMGPDGGYRLNAGAQLPPLLFDDDQVVALAVSLQTAVLTGAGIGEAAERALATLRQVLPARLRVRADAVDVTALGRGDRYGHTGGDVQADTEVLLAIGAAIRGREELRFDYRSPARPDEGGAGPDSRPPRRVQPHHLVARAGLWYLVAWVPGHQDWRIYRVDRIQPRIPPGPRFHPREVPGGDVAAFVAARFKGSEEAGSWPCRGEVLVDLPAVDVVPYLGDGLVEPVGPDRCRVQLGAWSWPGLAATLARFDAVITVVSPPELREAFAGLARRAAHAARTSEPATDR